MGIYPTEAWKRLVDPDVWVRTVETPGLKVTETYQLVSRVEQRDDCFCCSCHDTRDPYCRNHGFYGKRPCEAHAMPGSPIEDTDEMPDSVQVERARQEGRSP